RAARDRPRAGGPRGKDRGDPVARDAAGRSAESRGPAGGHGPQHHRCRPALRQATGRGADPPPADHPRGGGHGRGGRGRRVRRPCADAGQRRRADRRRPQAPHHAPARPLPGPGQAGQAIRRSRPQRSAHRRHGLEGAAAEQRRRGAGGKRAGL
ncbi:MAG: 1-deoxy-D-xylulose 5-phosphate synthase, partial [uncultured Sphingomonas sp.]